MTAAELLSPGLVARLEGLDVRSSRVFAGKLQGERRSKRRGQSTEFDDFRPYVAGDDLRRIDWNIFARLDRFFLKLFEEEQDLTVHVVVDASASMLAGSPMKLVAASRLACALGWVALVNNNRLMLSAFGLPEGAVVGGARATGPGGLARLEPLRGRTSTQRAAAFVLDLLHVRVKSPLERERGGAGVLTEGLRTIARARTGRGVMVVLSDLLVPAEGGPASGGGGPGYGPGLSLVSGSDAFEVYVFQVLSPGELDPSKEPPLRAGGEAPVWGDLELIDAEGGRGRQLTVTADLIERYRRAASAYVEQAGAWCRRAGVRHGVLLSDRSTEEGVVDALRSLGVVV